MSGSVRGAQGRFQPLDGNQDLYVTNLYQVVAAIDAVAATAKKQK